MCGVYISLFNLFSSRVGLKQGELRSPLMIMLFVIGIGRSRILGRPRFRILGGGGGGGEGGAKGGQIPSRHMTSY